MFTVLFWRGAGERAIKTFAQSLLGGLIITAPVVEQPWLIALGVAGSATLFSLLTSIGSSDFVAGKDKVHE